jgi:ABC-2 type transport system permease protein
VHGSFPLLAKKPLSLETSTAFFVLCFFFPLLSLIGIYLAHNLSFLANYGASNQILKIDNKFFFYFINVQCVLGLMLTAFTGPGLISPDLANGALPLYFCRPFSRAEYVLGKASVLAIVLSEITWIPGLILFAVQASLAGATWTWNNFWMMGSLVLSSLVWIAILSLLAMALSAWVKWRIVAGALLLAVFFFGAGFAQAINAVMRTQSGHFIDIVYLTATVWTSLFRIENDRAMSSGAAWIALLFYCGICLALLVRKVRAYEVIK